MSRLRPRAHLLAGVAWLALHSLPALAACEGRSACVDAILDAARDGRDADEYAAMNALRGRLRTSRTSATVSVPAAATPSEEDILTLPDDRRAVLVATLEPGRLDDAIGRLEAGLKRVPYHAPYWVDLATAFARQNRHERAVAALIVADTWSGDRVASQRAWAASADMAGPADQASIRTDIAMALARIAALDTEHAHTDSALPSVRGDTARWKAAVIDFKTCPYPSYPVESLRNEETGQVNVTFLVGLDGSVQRGRNTASSGHVRLDNEAMLSLADCHFRPAMLDGRPVAAWQPVKYVWTLE